MSKLSICVVLVAAMPAFAGLVLSQNDGAVPVNYSNGGGGGFGGTLGGSTISFDESGGNLNIAFTPGNALNDIVAIYLDTRPGGFADSQMDDQQDGGRKVISNLTRDVDDAFATGMTNGLPDFGLAIGNFGSVLFELNAGNTPGHLAFQVFNGAQNISIPMATLGNPTVIDWFAGYSSDTNYNSNESMPAYAPLNGSANPGQSGPSAGYDNFNRFVVPEPVTLTLLALGGLGLLRRRSA